MCCAKSSEEIQKIALAFDKSLEAKNLDQILDNFSEDCEIELLNIKLFGKEGVKKWFNWVFTNVAKFELSPVTIMVEGNVFFEEFVVRATFYDGKKAQSKQAEVLIFDNSKIKSLRLYFDRLDFSSSIAKDLISKTIINQIIKKSLEGLV
jgi:ketosteroid isomerase-like protein